MTRDQLEIAFLDWWRRKYPSSPPNARIIQTHAAFAEYALEMADTLREYNRDPV